MKYIWLFISLFELGSVKAQEVNEKDVEPYGVYKTINLSEDNRRVSLLAEAPSPQQTKLVDSVLKSPNKYIPPVLFALSNALLLRNENDKGTFWFYAAQLRARYDVNRCSDKTATAAAYNQTFGLEINLYAFDHIDKLKKIIKEVIEFVKTNDELYDQRWINLSGMDAMNASLNKEDNKKNLSVDKREWPKIKAETIKSYGDDFYEAMASLEKK
jgi:hypothetical protein